MNGLMIQPAVSAVTGLKGSAQATPGKNNGIFSELLLAASQGGGTGNAENSLLSALVALIEGAQSLESPEGENTDLLAQGQGSENDAFLALLASLMNGQELPVSQMQPKMDDGQGAGNSQEYPGILQLPKTINTGQLEQLVDRMLSSGKEKLSVAAVPEKESLAGQIVQLLSSISAEAEQFSSGKLNAEEQAAIKLLSLLKQAESGKVSLPSSTNEKVEQAAALLIKELPQIAKLLEGKRDQGKLFQSAERVIAPKYSAMQNMLIAEGDQTLQVMENSGVTITTAGETQKVAHFQYYPQLANLNDSVGLNQTSETTAFSVPLQNQSTAAPLVRVGEFTKHMATFMAQRMDLLSENGTSQATIRLYPENLGQVDVKIVTQNGQVTAHFMTETAVGRELIESQMASLRAALTQQGLQVERLQVSYSPSTPLGGMAGESMFHQQQRSFKEQHSSSNRSHFAIYGTGELEEESFLLPQIDGQTTGIDYMA